MTVGEIFNKYALQYGHSAHEEAEGKIDLVQSAYNSILVSTNLDTSVKLVNIKSDKDSNIILPIDFRHFPDTQGFRNSPIWLMGDDTNVNPMVVIPPHQLSEYDFVTGTTGAYFYRGKIDVGGVSREALIWYNGTRFPTTDFSVVYRAGTEVFTSLSDIPSLIPHEYHEMISIKMAIDSYRRKRLSSEQLQTFELLKREYENYTDGLLDNDIKLFRGN